MSNSATEELAFTHAVLEGTSYEVGYLQGAAIKDYPQAVEFFTSGEGLFSDLEFAGVIDLFDDFCPGLNEEIEGFADCLDVSPEQAIYYASTYLKAGPSPEESGNCSHMAVLPSISENEHVLVGRSYEFSDRIDDLRLCTTRIKGKADHIGFSTFFFGRSEGMNEHGLSTTMSSARVPVGVGEGMQPLPQSGFQSWAVLRAVLDYCKNVEEALALMDEMPLCCNLNLIVADRRGKAALIEISGREKAVKLLDASSEEQFLCSTNHLTIPSMVPHIPYAMKNSALRQEILESSLQEASPEIGPGTLSRIFTQKYPDGVCCSYYDEFFGTLRSLIFDLTTGETRVCFGPPALNEWHIFNLENPSTSGVYQAKIVKEKAEPGFWEIVALD
ncbi:C45 family autoproteolytic acyltransferase/hydrolase [Methanosarcina sp. Mfa9]|uniref:C45 family autoproteolytic acyltransferase/hydolase n=1 Tax=Methanosarcina sp. Mfa9 TaxID=3439063 RepID=UPI003F82AE0E